MSGVEGGVISFDYHQVLDIDRGLRPPERVGFSADDCHLPLRNIEAIADLRLCYPGLNVVVCSYIPRVRGSIRANDNFAGAARALSHERHFTSFNRAMFVPQTCGPEGKLEALTSIYPRARVVHLDDDKNALEEINSNRWCAAIGTRVPRKPQCANVQYFWSITDALPMIQVILDQHHPKNLRR